MLIAAAIFFALMGVIAALMALLIKLYGYGDTGSQE